MAHVHIRAIKQTKIGWGNVSLVYHIPIDSPVAGVVPTPVSTIDAELGDTERVALADRSLVEATQRTAVLQAQSKSEIVEAINADWRNVKADFNQQYRFEHKYHGTVIEDATS
ncbi:MAG: hypothetical protein JSU70_18460 [Phycisphaerales bacterium]|nr:MAG: hypothetical protein JSU70_18460 [Phycisphaerales bacterium]